MGVVIPFPPATILIADDDPGLRETLSEFLSMCGYRTFEATLAKDALEMLENHRVDLMTTDISKPGMDGFELTRIVKIKHGIPVIVATGYTGHTQEQALQAGADLFIYKPVRFKKMLLAIKSLLAKR